ncbi:unnamed protein product [Ranitomeya imitator]|uniref:Dynactin subunit 6 n=1 Tax=Ranitomeya imitator TaxID=111125 RepID=A0ABN9LBP2_9NEOB|nr:unnamed protein product [Ranitomeya imitator]
MAELLKQAQLQKSVKIAPGAVVCVESEIKGDVTIGPRTVVHPKARIYAEAGPIIIGEGNLIEEQAFIRNSFPENIAPDSEDVEPKTMIIGTNNVFEVGCCILPVCKSSNSQAMKMGDNNVIESKAYVGRNVILTSGCIIGACCQVDTCELIPENTVIYGSDCLRRVQTERPQVGTVMLSNTITKESYFSDYTIYGQLLRLDGESLYYVNIRLTCNSNLLYSVSVVYFHTIHNRIFRHKHFHQSFYPLYIAVIMLYSTVAMQLTWERDESPMTAHLRKGSAQSGQETY